MAPLYGRFTQTAIATQTPTVTPPAPPTIAVSSNVSNTVLRAQSSTSNPSQSGTAPMDGAAVATNGVNATLVSENQAITALVVRNPITGA